MENIYRERFANIRKRAGFSAKELSLKVSNSDYYVSRLENGLFEPRLKMLTKLLDICGSSLEELYAEDFENFKWNKEFVAKVGRVGTNERNAILTILVGMFHEKKKAETKEKE